MCTIFCISLNLGSASPRVSWSSIEMQNCSLSLLLVSLKSGFKVLEWRLISPSLNFLCNVETLTSKDLASDFKVDLLRSGILAIRVRSSSTFLRPTWAVFLLETSTSCPSAICSLAHFQILWTTRIRVWKKAATSFVAFFGSFPFLLFACKAAYTAYLCASVNHFLILICGWTPASATIKEGN